MRSIANNNCTTADMKTCVQIKCKQHSHILVFKSYESKPQKLVKYSI